MNRQEIEDYRIAHPVCEIAGWLPGYRQKSLVYPATGQVVTISNREAASELHHICGSATGAKRINHISNVIHLCHDAHTWVSAHVLAGRVLCMWIKEYRGEMDWGLISKNLGQRVPDSFDTDRYAVACKPFPFVERMREDIIGRL